MGAQALAPRKHKTSDPEDDLGLCFEALPGRLAAVCGLAGGAGTTTLAVALAQAAARSSSAAVLLTETGSQPGGLATVCGTASPLSLAELAQAAAAGQRPERPFAQLQAGPRLVAAPPRQSPDVDEHQLAGVLGDAKLAHGLVVVDCATVSGTQHPVFAQADLIVWTLPATPAAVARAQVLFASPLVPRAGRVAELMVAGALLEKPKTPVKALRRLAEHRCDQLVLIPRDHQVAHGHSERWPAAYAEALQAITRVLA